MARTKIYVPRETSAVSVGADEVALAIAQVAKKNGVDIELIRNGSWGASWLEPLVEVEVDGARIAYGNVSANDIEGLFELVKDEINIKSISVDDNVESLGRYELFVNARAAGPRLGKNTKEVIVASKKGAWTDLGNGKIEVAGYTLEGEEFELRLVPR